MKTLALLAALLMVSSSSYAGKANTELEAQSSAGRAALLTSAIGNSGFSCGRVTKYLFMGEKKGADWFSLRCTSGQDFALRITNSINLETRALPCKALKAAGAACWVKLDTE